MELCARELAVWRGERCLFEGLDLELGPGQLGLVVGANGSGKSTLLRVLAGLATATSGVVTWRGSKLEALPFEYRGDIAYRGHLDGLKRDLTVLENLEMGSYISAAKARRSEGLAQVFALFPRLEERRGQAAGTMSGGEQQMLAIGRALMARPRVLMLDEPSLGLAPLVVREILHIVADLRKTGVSILMVEQNARAALQVADYGYVLENGEITVEGPAQEQLEVLLGGQVPFVGRHLGRPHCGCQLLLVVQRQAESDDGVQADGFGVDRGEFDRVGGEERAEPAGEGVRGLRGVEIGADRRAERRRLGSGDEFAVQGRGAGRVQ